MDKTFSQFVVETREQNASQESAVATELCDLQLALVGGGIGDTIL
jgi:hypothetical protein